MAGLAQFAGWLATQVFDVVGSVAGVQGSDADDAGIDLQVGRTVFHDVPAKVGGSGLPQLPGVGLSRPAGSTLCAAAPAPPATAAAAAACHQMRTELWMSQLQRKGSKGAATMGEYRDLLFEVRHRPGWCRGLHASHVHAPDGVCAHAAATAATLVAVQKLSEDVLAEIDKDTHRTFPGHKRCVRPAWAHGRHSSGGGKVRASRSALPPPAAPPAAPQAVHARGAGGHAARAARVRAVRPRDWLHAGAYASCVRGWVPTVRCSCGRARELISCWNPGASACPPPTPRPQPPPQQGMNFLAGLLLTYLPSEAEAYCALALLMRQRGLREMYLPDMSVLQIRLWQLGKLLPPTLAAHLEAHAVLPVLYVSGGAWGRRQRACCTHAWPPCRCMAGHRPPNVPPPRPPPPAPAGLLLAAHLLCRRLPLPLCGTRDGCADDRASRGLPRAQGAQCGGGGGAEAGPGPVRAPQPSAPCTCCTPAPTHSCRSRWRS